MSHGQMRKLRYRGLVQEALLWVEPRAPFLCPLRWVSLYLLQINLESNRTALK